MKMISESKYKYIGPNGAWHMFISREVGSDREILCVQRARYLLVSGGTKVFGRIADRKEVFKDVDNKIDFVDQVKILLAL
jgi:hypothetical protein